MLHAHLFLLPHIVPHMFHALSFASVCISQKVGSESRTPWALITPSQLYHSQRHAVTFYFQCSTVSSSSRLLFLRPQRITHGIFGAVGDAVVEDVTTRHSVVQTDIFFENIVFRDSVITGCNFHFKQHLWRQIQKYRSYGGI